MVEVTSARELMETIEKGQLRRHTSSTAMNRESSRSHLIMSIIIEATNLQTQNVTKGKLSFVDLAGSERCGAPCKHTWRPSRQLRRSAMQLLHTGASTCRSDRSFLMPACMQQT
jgi:hypothetical protein